MKDSDRCILPCYKADVVARLRREALPPEMVRAIADLFGLLADSTRLRIITALAAGEELCVCDVANVLGLSLSATSHQLRKLREAGVVSLRNDGRMAYYRLQDGFLSGLIHLTQVQVLRTHPQQRFEQYFHDRSIDVNDGQNG